MSNTNGAPVRLGARLRHAREQRQLSLGDVAERTGLSRGFLSRVERDKTSPSVASLVAVCEAISLPLGRLFGTPGVTVVRAADRPTARPPRAGGRGHPDHAGPRVARHGRRDAGGARRLRRRGVLHAPQRVRGLLSSSRARSSSRSTARPSRSRVATRSRSAPTCPHTWRNPSPQRRGPGGVGDRARAARSAWPGRRAVTGGGVFRRRPVRPIHSVCSPPRGSRQMSDRFTS